MADCCFPVLLPLLACFLWGAYLNYTASAEQGGCISRRVKFLPPKNGHYLEGHVFLNLTIGINIPCQRRCVMERECVSVNIGPAVNDKIVCELSNSDHLQHPQDLKPRQHWNYRGNENLCATYPCLNNGKCYSGYTDKKYLCECPSGYTGENCEKDVDECKDGTHDCDENANCTNIPGSFNCSCKMGYTGNGNLCSDVNECKDGTHDCDENADCTNIPGSFNCSCKKGYTGNGSLCSDVNECKDGTHDCHKNASCTNIPGSFNCSCTKGFTGNGSLCSDIDECSNGTHDCHKNATCTNIPGSFNCSCYKDFIGDGRSCAVYKNCAELYKAGHLISGVYPIDPDNGSAFDVFCDQTTAGGGWTVFQKRLDGSVDFYRGWDDYKRGFGNLNGEYWLGLDKIHRLTKERSRLRVDLEDTNGTSAYAEYDLFVVGDGANKYNLSLGTYSGNAGDSLSYHRGMAFTTKDRDNDNWPNNCATKFKGAWWYSRCHRSNLNGLYHHGQHSSFADGVNWLAWKGLYYSAKRAEMKIKPVNT